MKNQSFLAIVFLISISCFSQQSRFYADPREKFKEAKEYFQKDEYSLAYPLFKELQQSIRETDKADNPITSQEINYYTIVCELKQNEGRAEEKALRFIDMEKNSARVEMISFHLGEYYYRQQKFADAADQYEKTNIANLSNREIAD
ncbi:MAG TPA: hypothetical protein VET23_14810, partial [Chitinophagaceae bacterium]|nr:hypothetical protein [Chitinophagaceae bacterium]